jgi:hypothetical protein
MWVMTTRNAVAQWNSERFKVGFSPDGSTTEPICFVFVLWQFVEPLRNITAPEAKIAVQWNPAKRHSGNGGRITNGSLRRCR